MKITILTIFPEFFDSPLKVSLLAKAIEASNLEIELVDIRKHTLDKHRSVDDAPYGGGTGMVIKVEPLYLTLSHVMSNGISHNSNIVLTSAAGRKFDQQTAIKYSLLDDLVIICGRYKGVDARIHSFFDIEEISIGDYVLNGGETAALAIVEAVFRLLPGGIAKIDSALSDSFIEDILGPPVWTRPDEFRGSNVPSVMLGGDHARQQHFRRWTSLKRTMNCRPDLLRKAVLSDGDREMLEQLALGHEFEDCY